MAGSEAPPAPAAGTVVYPISRNRIKDIPEDDRPRETFERAGPEAVSDRILLAILIRSGVRGYSAVDMAEELLNRFGSLQAMAREPVDEIARIPGMGKVRAQVVKAALELGRRIQQVDHRHRTEVRTPEDVASVMRSASLHLEVEQFWVLLLDTKYRLRRPPAPVSTGILDACLIHPREVFKEAIRACAAAVILVHNHPSGDSGPSAEDIRLTRRMIEAGRLMDIEVLDHVIMGRPGPHNENGFTSLRESGLLSFERTSS